MFEDLRPQTTPEEKRQLVMEAVIAAVAVAAIGVGLVWFFGFYGV